MENRERDRVSQRASPTEAGDVNRRTEEEKGRQQSGTGAEFGQKIGRSENLEGGNMRTRNDETMTNIGSSTGSGREVREDDSSIGRNSGSGGFGSSSGRSGSGSMGNTGSSSDEKWRDDSDSDRSRKDSSEGRH